MKTPLLPVLLACLLAACAGERVILLPGSSGHTGAVAVLDGKGGDKALLDSPYASAALGAGSVKPRTLEAQAVEREYGTLIRALPPAPRVFVLQFEEGTTSLVPESLGRLQELLAEVAARPGAEVQVTGHTDRVGKLEDNDALSRQRADSVRQLLVERGLAAELVRAVGRGEREPLVPTDDEAAEPRNRRVEALVR